RNAIRGQKRLDTLFHPADAVSRGCGDGGADATARRGGGGGAGAARARRRRRGGGVAAWA
ncbi:hypothetical protein, partial [Microbacterium sp. 22296]|uniref:hypothetical protein n=1 Tax=Microbacterium sp. 22296 TaxID=3453903 RepID=UPI003F87496F